MMTNIVATFGKTASGQHFELMLLLVSSINTVIAFRVKDE